MRKIFMVSLIVIVIMVGAAAEAARLHIVNLGSPSDPLYIGLMDFDNDGVYDAVTPTADDPDKIRWFAKTTFEDMGLS